MLDFAFESLYETDSVASCIGSTEFLLCCLTSLICGLICAGVYMFKHNYQKNFVVTLALLPLIVQMVITLVNGNLGAGIAVMGVFNLVRFRTVPGSAKDITSVFFAMAIGLATGMGFIFLAVIFAVIVAIFNIIYSLSPLGKQKNPSKTLQITVPEDLEFEGMFDQILNKYVDEYKIEEIRTANMGSLYKITYSIRPKNAGIIKQMIDELRVLNGNLAISLKNVPTTANTL